MKRYPILLNILSLGILLTGCWSAQELTDITLATAMAIDTTDDGYMITLQVLNPKEIAGDQITDKANISTYSASGKSIFEANRRLTQALPRKMHLSHLQLIVYGEEVAKEGIGKTLDFLVRDHELRTDFTIAIAQGVTGQALISILTPLEEIPATKIRSSVESSEEFWAPTKEVKLDELIESVVSEGKEAILTGIHVEGNPEEGTKIKNTEQAISPTRIYLNGIGVFRGDKLQGWLDETESKGFNYITDNVSNTVSWVNCNDGGTISLEIMESNTNMQGSIDNGKPTINIDVTIKANVGDVECAIDLANPHEIQEVQKKAEQKTREIVNVSVAAAQEFRSDIFGFGNAIKRAHPKEWEQLKDNWGTLFPDVKVHVQTRVEIKEAGMITKTLYEAIKQKNARKE